MGVARRNMVRVLLAVVASVLCAGAAGDSYPLFSWSSSKGLFDDFEPDSASAVLAAKHKNFKASVVYLHSLSTKQLATHKLATEKMQGCIHKSESSIFRPLSDPSIQPDQLVAPYHGHVVLASEAVSFLNNHHEIFSGGEPQVLVVDMRTHEHGLEQLTEADSIRAQVHAALDSITGGDFLSVLASTQSAPGRKLLWLEAHPVSGEWEFYPLKTGQVRYLTSSSLLGLGAAMYMFFIAFCGYCCLFQLQTPDLFEGDQKKEMDRALGNEAASK